MRSLRSDLLIALLGALLLALLLGAWATYRAEFQQADALLDYHLRQIALALRDQGFQDPAVPSLATRGDDFDFAVQVWNEQGVTIYYSYPQHVFPNRAQLGFDTVSTQEGPWRVFAMQGRAEIIQVAQPMSRRNQLAASAAWRSLQPFLLLFPLMGGLIWFIVGRGLAPIARLARAVSARTATLMSPVAEPVPEEIQPLVLALNDLLARLKGSFDLQRQFVADAAHQLRTPLTALQLQAELVDRAGSAVDRSAASADLKLGLERIVRVVQQLLTLAREEPGAVHGPRLRIDVEKLIGDVIDTYRPIAQQKSITLVLSLEDTGLPVYGDAAALHTLVANIIDNALHYTPPGGTVRINTARGDSHVILNVEDSGPGIPSTERQRVFDRFYRREGTSQPGSGLGLAIVKAIAARHELRVSLDQAREGGLLVRIEFPAGVLSRS